MSARAIKGLLFDKDGTLFDFAATWEQWAAAFLVRAFEGDTGLASQAGQTIGFDLEQRKFKPGSVVVAGTPGEIAQALAPFLPKMNQHQIIDLLNSEAEIAEQTPAVPLMPFLTDLRQRDLRLGVATNDAQAPAVAHLASAGVLNMFDFVAGFDAGFGAKPAPGQLLAFADQVNIAPQDVAMVGDSAHDLLAGRAAGMHTIGVLTGLASAQDLAPLADVVLRDIGEIPGWLDAR
ncbi:MAG: HAD family hydrolase [Sedimentitalea sp.]